MNSESEAILEDIRQKSVIHEFEGIPEIDFSSDQKTPPAEISRYASGIAGYSWLLWERRILLWKTFQRALLASTLLAILIPSRYDSTTRIMPPEQNEGGAIMALLAAKGSSSAGAASSGLNSLAGSFLGMKTTGALFADLLHSRTVQDHIIERYDLQKVYRARYKEDARKLLDKRTDVNEDRKSGVISITVTDKNALRARDMAQAYVEELDRLVSQVSTSSARRERIFVEQRMASVKNDLEDAEQKFSAFASKNTALDIKEQSKAMVESAATLQGQLIGTQSELQALEQIYTPSNVRVRSLKARIQELQQQLQKLGGTDAALAQDASSATSQDIYPSIRKLPLLGVEWADLYRRTKIQETVYELLTQEYEMARIQEAKEIPTIRVIDPANVPEKKSWPPRLLIIVGLTGISFLIAAVFIISTDYWQRLDSQNPGKLLGETIWERIRAARWKAWSYLRINRNARSTRN